MNDAQAWYENDDTGVYFVFDLTHGGHVEDEAEDDERRPDDGLVMTDVSFNLNYYRPHVFGLEGELELTAFVSHFGLQVEDPQMEGMGRGPYSREGFLRGWNAGNLVGYGACTQAAEEGKMPPPETLPEAAIDCSWRWSYNRNALQAELGDDMFVPRISWVRVDGHLQSGVVWTDAIPVALPRVDCVLLVRQQLAPRRFFFRRQDVCRVDFAALDPLLHEMRLVDAAGGPYYRLEYDAPPVALRDFFTRQSPVEMKGLAILSTDSILSRELFDRARHSTAQS